jgi:hypothetical protein
MKCNTVQMALMEDGDRDEAAVERHLGECKVCKRFVERLEVAERALADHHGNVVPDSTFAARVVSELPQPSPVMGWAALRLLPAAAALLLALSAWVWLGTAPPAELTVSAPTDDLVSWVLEDGEVGE